MSDVDPGERVSAIRRVFYGIDRVTLGRELIALVDSGEWREYDEVTNFQRQRFETFREFIEKGLGLHVETILDALSTFPSFQRRVKRLVAEDDEQLPANAETETGEDDWKAPW